MATVLRCRRGVGYVAQPVAVRRRVPRPRRRRAFFAEWLATWDDYAVENDELIGAGDSVVVVFRQRGRGKGSGLNAERTFFGVYDLKAAKVIGFRLYESREAALEAVGLSA